MTDLESDRRNPSFDPATVVHLVAELDRAKATIVTQHDRIRDLESQLADLTTTIEDLTHHRPAPDRQARAYRIALRPDEHGYLDDVVVHDVDMFRMEDMGDSWWLCCYLSATGENRICWSLRIEGGRIVATITETPTDATYEPGAAPEDVTHAP